MTDTLKELAERAKSTLWASDEVGICVGDGFVVAVQLPDEFWGLAEEDVPAPVLAQSFALYDFLAAASPDRILALISENERLREALKPFADASEACDDPSLPDRADAWESPEAMSVNRGDFRRARSALKGEEQ